MSARQLWTGIAGLVIAFFIFIVPFIFIFLTASKTAGEAAELAFTWPSQWNFWQNLVDVFQARNYIVLLAFFNSALITFSAVTLLVIFAAMVGYVLQRRKSATTDAIYSTVLAGMMIPPAVVPTIWVLQSLGLFKSIPGMVLIEVTYGLAFSVLLYRNFISTIPRDLDEAARIDGATPWQIFFKVILPLLRPVTLTIITVQSINIFNDFVNPLYYLPGRQNVTVQLTLYNFQSQFQSQYNLMFMNILLVTVAPLIAFIFLNRQIVAGMTAGAVKG